MAFDRIAKAGTIYGKTFARFYTGTSAELKVKIEGFIESLWEEAITVNVTPVFINTMLLGKCKNDFFNMDKPKQTSYSEFFGIVQEDIMKAQAKLKATQGFVSSLAQVEQYIREVWGSDGPSGYTEADGD